MIGDKGKPKELEVISEFNVHRWVGFGGLFRSPLRS